MKHLYALALSVLTAGGLMVSQVNAQVMTEDFGNSSLPTGWTNTSSSPSGNGLWKFSGNPGYNLSGTQDFTPGGGGWYAWVDGSSPATIPNVTLETDDISMVVGSAASLTFWLRSENTTNPGDNQTISVNFYDGSTWNNGVWTYAGDSPTWDQISINLGAYPVTGSGDVRFQFVVDKTTAGTAFYNDILIDDIEVGVLLDDNAGLDAFTSPTVPFCSDSTICVILSNSGLDPLMSVDISYTINGGTPVTYAWTGNLASGSTDTVCLDTIMFANGDALVAYTSNPNGSPEDPAGNSNDTISYAAVSGLVGIYQIPADYATFEDAAIDLETYGICGDVIFNVATGVYNEQITIGEVNGTGPATVTFRGATGNPGDVTLEFDCSSNFSQDGVVKLDGADYINFEDMTIDNLSTSTSWGRVVYMPGGASHINIDNCILDGSDANTTSTNNVVVDMDGNYTNNTITNSEIIGGSYAIRAFGNSSSHSSKLTIDNNVIKDFYYFGIYAYYTDSLSIAYNQMTTNKAYTSMRGVYIYDCDRMVDVDHNFISNDPNAGGNMYYGIYLSQCDGSLANHLTVSNNCVATGNPTYTGFSYTISFWTSGIMDVYNNTIHRDAAPTSTSGYVQYISGGGLIDERNNSFTTTGSMYVSYITSTYSLIASDNNNYYNNGGNFLYLNGLYSTVEDFAAQTGFDQNSVSTNPEFTDTLACATCNDTLDGGGVVVSGVTDDVNGQVRSSTTPDIGAVEYIAAGSFDLGGDSTYCADELLLESGPAQTVTWNVDGVASSNPTVLLQANNGEPQTFNVAVNIQTIGCGPASDNLLVTLVPGADLDSNVHICAEETATLEPGGGNNAVYTWNTGEATATIDVDEPGTYTVTKMEEGCESEATIVVTKSTAVALQDADVCSEDLPFSLDATIPDGVSYAWSGGSAVTSAVNTFNDGDNYSVTVTDAFACVSQDNFQLTVLEEPVAAIAETHSGLAYFFDASSSIYVTPSSVITWDFGNGQTGTGLMDTVIYNWSNPSNPTSYTVTLTIDNGCGESIENMEVLPSVGINDVVTGSFAVYPNPANEIVNVQLTQSFGEQGSVEFVDISGRTVKTETINASTDLAQYNVAELASGTYIVKITGDSQVLVSRVTIK